MVCLSQHEDGPGILIEYMSQSLDATRTRELEEHIAVCAECRALVNVGGILDEWSVPDVSPDFDRKLYARIAAEAQAPWWKRPFTFEHWWKPAIPVAVGCAALAVMFVIRTPDPGVEPDTKAKIEQVNIEQVEQGLEDLDLLAPMSAAEQL